MSKMTTEPSVLLDPGVSVVGVVVEVDLRRRVRRQIGHVEVHAVAAGLGQIVGQRDQRRRAGQRIEHSRNAGTGSGRAIDVGGAADQSQHGKCPTEFHVLIPRQTDQKVEGTLRDERASR
jgi:hypothetical protein